jgi:hypothetical protein
MGLESGDRDGVPCLNNLFYIFNWVVVGCGIGLIVAGAWGLDRLQPQNQIASNTGTAIAVCAIIIGAAMVILGGLGCLGALREHWRMLRGVRECELLLPWLQTCQIEIDRRARIPHPVHYRHFFDRLRRAWACHCGVCEQERGAVSSMASCALARLILRGCRWRIGLCANGPRARVHPSTRTHSRLSTRCSGRCA